MLFGSTNPNYSPTGTCSRAPPVDLWGPDDERSSRPVLREREGESPSRHSPNCHVRFGPEAAGKGPSSGRAPVSVKSSGTRVLSLFGLILGLVDPGLGRHPRRMGPTSEPRWVGMVGSRQGLLPGLVDRVGSPEMH